MVSRRWANMKDRTVIVVFFVIGIIATLGISTLYTAVIAPAFAPPPTLDQRYQAAIEDSMVAKESEITTNLTPITLNNSNLIWQGEGENATVLVVTWTKYINSYPVGENITISWGEYMGNCSARNANFLPKPRCIRRQLYNSSSTTAGFTCKHHKHLLCGTLG